MTKPCADPGIFVKGEGGSDPTYRKSSDKSLFSFRGGPMVISNKTIVFKILIETYRGCDFQGGGVLTPVPLLHPRMSGIGIRVVISF